MGDDGTNDNITVRILTDIRDELRDLRGEVRQTNARLDQTNARLDVHIEQTDRRFDQLGNRIVESELRTATAIHELGGTMHQVHDLLRDRLDLRDRVDRCERDIAELKVRVR